MLLAGKKKAMQTTKVVLLFKAILLVLPILVLWYDAWSQFQPVAKLTLVGYAKVIDGDTLSVSGSLLILSKQNELFWPPCADITRATRP
jgi:hypothetical protein